MHTEVGEARNVSFRTLWLRLSMHLSSCCHVVLWCVMLCVPTLAHLPLTAASVFASITRCGLPLICRMLRASTFPPLLLPPDRRVNLVLALKLRTSTLRSESITERGRVRRQDGRDNVRAFHPMGSDLYEQCGLQHFECPQIH